MYIFPIVNQIITPFQVYLSSERCIQEIRSMHGPINCSKTKYNKLDNKTILKFQSKYGSISLHEQQVNFIWYVNKEYLLKNITIMYRCNCSWASTTENNGIMKKTSAMLLAYYRDILVVINIEQILNFKSCTISPYPFQFSQLNSQSHA